MKTEKLSSYGPKILILTNFWNIVKSVFLWALIPSFFKFLHITKFVTVTWTIYIVSYFFPSDEFHFFGLSTIVAYFKSRFIIRWNINVFFLYFVIFSSKFIHFWCLPISFLTIKSISHCYLLPSLNNFLLHFFSIKNSINLKVRYSFCCLIQSSPDALSNSTICFFVSPVEQMLNL